MQRTLTWLNLYGCEQGLPIVTLYSYLSILVGKISFTFFCFSVSLKQNLVSRSTAKSYLLRILSLKQKSFKKSHIGAKINLILAH